MATLACQLNLLLVHGRYLVNKEYYSQVLCENRSKPDLECEGRCALQKELNEEQTSPRHNATFPEYKLECIPTAPLSAWPLQLWLPTDCCFAPLNEPVAVQYFPIELQPPEA